MKKLFAVAFLGLATLGLSTGHARAGWLWHHPCHSCDVLVHCHQYNAFSPPCCPGDNCMKGNGAAPGYGAACSGAAGWDGHAMQMGQLPAPNAWSAGALAGQMMPIPGSGAIPMNPPMVNSPGAVPNSLPALTQQVPTGMIRPNGPSLYYPALNPGYAPAAMPQAH